MSTSSKSSDLDINQNDLTEDVSIQLVKSSTRAQFLVNLNTLPSTQATPTFPKSFQKSSKSPPVYIKPPKTLKTHKSVHKISDLFNDCKIPPTKTDLNERCSQFKEKVKAKIEKMAQDQEELIKKDCPFKPQLLNNKRSARKLGEFLTEMKNFEINKDKKLVNMRCRKTQVFDKSKIVNKIPVKGKESDLVYEKLYNEGRICKMGRKGGGKEDGRAKSENFEYVEDSENYRKFDNKVEIGDRVLVAKFKNEFFKIIFGVFGKDKEEFGFEDFFRVLVELRFIRNDVCSDEHKNEILMTYKAWDWVCRKVDRGGVTNVEKMLEFFLEIMNYEENCEDNCAHSEFISFYECRHWFVINRNNIYFN